MLRACISHHPSSSSSSVDRSIGSKQNHSIVLQSSPLILSPLRYVSIGHNQQQPQPIVSSSDHYPHPRAQHRNDHSRTDRLVTVDLNSPRVSLPPLLCNLYDFELEKQATKNSSQRECKSLAQLSPIILANCNKHKLVHHSGHFEVKGSDRCPPTLSSARCYHHLTRSTPTTNNHQRCGAVRRRILGRKRSKRLRDNHRRLVANSPRHLKLLSDPLLGQTLSFNSIENRENCLDLTDNCVLRAAHRCPFERIAPVSNDSVCLHKLPGSDHCKREEIANKSLPVPPSTTASIAIPILDPGNNNTEQSNDRRWPTRRVSSVLRPLTNGVDQCNLNGDHHPSGSGTRSYQSSPLDSSPSSIIKDTITTTAAVAVAGCTTAQSQATVSWQTVSQSIAPPQPLSLFLSESSSSSSSSLRVQQGNNTEPPPPQPINIQTFDCHPGSLNNASSPPNAADDLKQLNLATQALSDSTSQLTACSVDHGHALPPLNGSSIEPISSHSTQSTMTNVKGKPWFPVSTK